MHQSCWIFEKPKLSLSFPNPHHVEKSSRNPQQPWEIRPNDQLIAQHCLIKKFTRHPRHQRMLEIIELFEIIHRWRLKRLQRCWSRQNRRLQKKNDPIRWRISHVQKTISWKHCRISLNYLKHQSFHLHKNLKNCWLSRPQKKPQSWKLRLDRRIRHLRIKR